MRPLYDSTRFSVDQPFTRRTFLRYGGSLGASVAAASSGGAIWRAASALRRRRRPADGLLDSGGAAVRLLNGAYLLPGQPLVLLGSLPDLPQPPLPDGGDGLREHRHDHRKPVRPAASERHDLGPPACLR